MRTQSAPLAAQCVPEARDIGVLGGLRAIFDQGGPGWVGAGGSKKSANDFFIFRSGSEDDFFFKTKRCPPVVGFFCLVPPIGGQRTENTQPFSGRPGPKKYQKHKKRIFQVSGAVAGEHLPT